MHVAVWVILPAAVILHCKAFKSVNDIINILISRSLVMIYIYPFYIMFSPVSICCCVGWLHSFVVGMFICLCFCLFVCWSVGWLVCWLVCWLVGWLISFVGTWVPPHYCLMWIWIKHLIKAFFELSQRGNRQLSNSPFLLFPCGIFSSFTKEPGSHCCEKADYKTWLY